MSEPIVVEYGGTSITYYETENVWKFELHGRERSAPSLTKAKEFIDKPESSKKSFKRVSAWLRKYGNYSLCEVTSIADDKDWSGLPYVWAVIDGRRSKESLEDLLENTSKNVAIIESISGIGRQIKALEKEQLDLASQLTNLPVVEA